MKNDKNRAQKTKLETLQKQKNNTSKIIWCKQAYFIFFEQIFAFHLVSLCTLENCFCLYTHCGLSPVALFDWMLFVGVWCTVWPVGNGGCMDLMGIFSWQGSTELPDCCRQRTTLQVWHQVSHWGSLCGQNPGLRGLGPGRCGCGAWRGAGEVKSRQYVLIVRHRTIPLTTTGN